MNFEFSEDEVAFRREIRRFLEAELPEWWGGIFGEHPSTMEATREFCQKLAARNWLTMSWPEEFGGAAASMWKQVVLREEMWAHGEPRGPQYMNLNYIGPLIMRYGTPEQQERFLKPMAAGTVLWCQGFSEPDAGSDLASLRTAARPAAGGYVVSGQKIWTSYADAPADWCFLLVRSDPGATRHDGLSILLLDMKTPGITVRPIRTMTGPREFNEVFFDEVFVPADCRLGDAGSAWEMLKTGLALERAGVPWYSGASAFLQRLIEFAAETSVDGVPLSQRAEIRRRLAELHCRCEAARLVAYRAVSAQEAGETTVVDSALAMMHNSQVDQFAGRVGLEVVGPLGQLAATDGSAKIGGEPRYQYVQSLTTTIVAGTIDIQRNIVAQRGLGLPRSR